MLNLNIFSSITNTSWIQEGIKFIPITEFDFKNEQINPKESLDHGFTDLDEFFPSWEIFLNRSSGNDSKYPNYMAFLMCKPNLVENSNQTPIYHLHIIGVLAVQLITYDEIEERNMAAVKTIENYLYLSWIALDRKYQAYNYFPLLFEYYNTLIRRFREILNTKLQGIAVTIRRMREVIWGLFNDNEECPTFIDNEFSKTSPRFDTTFVPYEIFNESFKPKQDHILIEFKSRKKIISK